MAPIPPVINAATYFDSYALKPPPTTLFFRFNYVCRSIDAVSTRPILDLLISSPLAHVKEEETWSPEEVSDTVCDFEFATAAAAVKSVPDRQGSRWRSASGRVSRQTMHACLCPIGVQLQSEQAPVRVTGRTDNPLTRESWSNVGPQRCLISSPHMERDPLT